MFKIRLFNLALVSALVSVTLFSMLGFSSSCNEMYDNIIRIRILANSDSQIDQELKLKVRDAVLEKSKSMFGEVNTYEDALAVTDKNLDALRETAQNTVYELGFDYFDCSFELATIYASDKFVIPSAAITERMFAGLEKIQGAISYDSSKVDGTYANYTTGYFTYKAPEAAA